MKIFLEIRNQQHEMWSEGTAEKKPTLSLITEEIKNRGYVASNIDIFYDDLMSIWRFSADIKNIEQITTHLSKQVAQL